MATPQGSGSDTLEPAVEELALAVDRIASLVAGDVTRVVVGGARSYESLRMVQALFPDARFVVLAADARLPGGVPNDSVTAITDPGMPHERAQVLRSLPVVDLVVWTGDPDQLNDDLPDMAWRLRHGGICVVVPTAVAALDADAELETKTASQTAISSDLGERALANFLANLEAVVKPPLRAKDSKVRPLARALRVVYRAPGVAVFRKRGTHRLKLRESTADAALAASGERELVDVRVVHPVSPWSSRARVAYHGEGPRPPSLTEMQPPPLVMRTYENVTALPRQVLASDSYYLPDTFRHPTEFLLSHVAMQHVSSEFATVRRWYRPRKLRKLEGTYYYLDTEYPGHFGHVLTEVASRLWGWDDALREYPDTRALVSSRGPAAVIPAWQQTLFAAYGIAEDDIEVIARDEVVEVERIVGVTPAFENPHYVHPVVSDVWARLARGLPQVESPVDADRIFITRIRGSRRSCLDADELESFFAEQGFAIVLPEEYSLAEQFALFRRAKVAAGYAGSGMFTMLANPSLNVILVASQTYTARNEALIAAANGSRLEYFWGKSLMNHPSGGWSNDAFLADWHFDVRQHAAELERAISASD